MRANGGSGGDPPRVIAEAALVATAERRRSKREAMVSNQCTTSCRDGDDRRGWGALKSEYPDLECRFPVWILTV